MPHYFYERKKPCVIVVRKYAELTQGGDRWVKFYKEKLMSSLNFIHCSAHEISMYLFLFLLCRDDDYCGKIVYPNGVPLRVDGGEDPKKTIIGMFNVTQGSRTDIYKQAIENLIIDKGMLLLEDTNEFGLAYRTKETAPLILSHTARLYKSNATSGEVAKQPVSQLPSLLATSDEVAEKLQPKTPDSSATSLQLPDKLQNSETAESNSSKEVAAESASDENITIKNKNKNKKDICATAAQDILDFWNSQGIINHIKLSDRMKRAVNGRLEEGLTLEEIIQAISNYSRILKDPKTFYFSHKWTLPLFLSRENALPMFKDWAVCSENCKRKDINKTPQNKEVKTFARGNDYYDNKKQS